MITRRALLSTAAPGAVALGLASCATPLIVNGGINPAFVDAVVTALQSGCAVGLSFIPTATAIANVVASLFGPAAIASVQLISGSVAAVASAICAAVPVSPAGQAHLRSQLLRSSFSAPVYIGTTPGGVIITGYHT